MPAWEERIETLSEREQCRDEVGLPDRRTGVSGLSGLSGLSGALGVYYLVPGPTHLLVSDDPTGQHIKHALVFFALAVLSLIGALRRERGIHTALDRARALIGIAAVQRCSMLTLLLTLLLNLVATLRTPGPGQAMYLVVCRGTSW